MFSDESRLFEGLFDEKAVHRYFEAGESIYEQFDIPNEKDLLSFLDKASRLKHVPGKAYEDGVVKLEKAQPCPVCHQPIDFAKSKHEERMHSCSTCGLTGHEKASHKKLVLEDFVWTYATDEEIQPSDERMQEEKRVIELYVKIWQKDGLEAREETELDVLAEKNQQRAAELLFKQP